MGGNVLRLRAPTSFPGSSTEHEKEKAEQGVSWSPDTLSQGGEASLERVTKSVRSLPRAATLPCPASH